MPIHDKRPARGLRLACCTADGLCWGAHVPLPCMPQAAMHSADRRSAHAAAAAAVQGEPLIVQVGWAATAVMFSFSLSLVVWGRSGL